MEGLLHHTDLTILLRSFLAHRSDSLFSLFDKSFLPAILQNRTEGNAGECRLPLCILLTSLAADNRGYNGIIPVVTWTQGANWCSHRPSPFPRGYGGSQEMLNITTATSRFWTVSVQFPLTSANILTPNRRMWIHPRSGRQGEVGLALSCCTAGEKVISHYVSKVSNVCTHSWLSDTNGPDSLMRTV